jgi:hypothetical protein
MKKYIRNKILFLFILLSLLFAIIYLNEYLISSQKGETFDRISIIVNIKYLTKNKHNLFYKFMRDINSTRNYYFIKNIGRPLNENLNELVENNTVKIVQSNFPDSIYLPLVVSLYGSNIPELVLFIEGEDIFENKVNKLIKWYKFAYNQIINNKYDYIFGNFQIIDGKKIGCSILLSKGSIIQHLLYHTDSDTTHVNPFIQLSLATDTKFFFLKFKYTKISELEKTNGKFSVNMNCPSINDNALPNLCMIIPAFKRNYFNESLPCFAKQTYKPKFYVIIQNDNRIYFNLSIIQNLIDEPVYHIWMQNWNPFFFLNHRLSSVLPCDFVGKFDDDQWPNDTMLIEKILNNTINKNVIQGRGGFLIGGSFCGYSHKGYNILENGVVDHASVPLMVRPGYFKLDARNKFFRPYGGEDIFLSLNSFKLCNVTSKKMKMNLNERQRDHKNQGRDKQVVSQHLNDQRKYRGFNLFISSYCYLIHSGFIQRRWKEIQPQKDFTNIEIEHKRLF